MTAPAADLSNWRTAPFSRWAFHHVDAVVPTAEVAAGPAGTAWALPEAPAALDGFHLSMVERPMDFAGWLEATGTDGIVILKDGRIVHEAYANGMTAQAPHVLMSATKAVVGLIVGVLHGRGEIDVEAPVSAYVPEIADGPYRGATVRQLLDMRTGITFAEAEQAAYLAATGWDPVADGQPASDLHNFFQTLRGEAKPHGGPFAYVSANTDLLGWVIERAAGRPFAEVASELLWKPLGAEAPALITTDAHGAPRCTGGFCATVRDFARLGQMVLQNGRRGEVEIVPPGWIANLQAGGDPEAWAEGEWGKLFGFAGSDMAYRAGWYAVNGAPPHLFAMGIHGQNLFVDREQGLVIAKVSSWALPIDYRALPLTHWGVAEIRRLLS